MDALLGLGLGLTLVVVGADLLVRGAARAAAAFGVPTLLVGLTVVAYGTSAPELAVSLQAGASARPDLALANLLGSNVFNVLAILGLAALVAPLAASTRVVRREIPLMLLVTVGAVVLGANGSFGRLDGVALLAGLALLTAGQLRAAIRSQRDAALARATASGAARARLTDAALIVGGLTALVVGARALVDAASAIALSLGVGEVTIGLTIVAVGTSLPELATSVVAALRGERDLAIGNVVGSNVFNLLGILGLTSLLAPAPLPVAPQVLAFDAWIVLFAAALLLPLARSGRTLVRWEGALLVGCYVAYLAVLVALAAGRIALPPSWVGIGLAGSALAVAAVTTLRTPRGSHP